MEYKIKVHDNDTVNEISVKKGTNLLYLLHKHAYDISSPCGGNGTCGKCRVRVEGEVEAPEGKEQKLLGKDRVAEGYRLACYMEVNHDMEVYIGKQKAKAAIMTQGRERDIRLNPIVSKKYVQLERPSLEDQRSDLSRLLSSMKKERVSTNLQCLRVLPEVLRQRDFGVTLVSVGKRVVAVEAGDTTDKIYGIAIDIGTTTLAAYLVDMKTGERVDVFSMLNPQKQYGADVVSRINHTLQNSTGLDDLYQTMVHCINEIIHTLVAAHGISVEDIYAIALVGNTTMMHFVMGIPAGNIAAAPFIPVSTELHKIPAADMGIHIHPQGYALIFPSVAAYIGADTVAAVLSSGMYEGEEICLLVDLGTNGEIVLGNSEWMFSCSAAAGPAFEGANIRNGVAGVNGAIDKVALEDDVHYTTIGNEKAMGICGSGIVDAVAQMLKRGIMDETGRILMDEEDRTTPLTPQLEQRLMEVEGINAFSLVPPEEGGNENLIAITQKDIREMQNAKAAIAAGIQVLIQRAGIHVKDIGKVYLAGGFGSYINITSAFGIGLIPRELEGRVESIGNAAGMGAVYGLLSGKLFNKTKEIQDKIEYVELSASPEFMDAYVECMMFES